MKNNACIQSLECRQYCQALDLLSSQATVAPCEWPEQIEAQAQDDSITIDMVAKHPELSADALKISLAQELGRVLSAAEAIREQLTAPDNHLAIAYESAKEKFMARQSLWEQFANAAKSDRVLTDTEVRHYTMLLDSRLKQADRRLKQADIQPNTATYAQAIVDRETLSEYSLLFDENMDKTVTNLFVNAMTGRSTLIIGDKGIAKTQAARFVSGAFSDDHEAKFVSGDGSMMKDELVGKMTLTEQNGATVTTFKRGILTECMEQGIPLVIDEINLIDPAIIMRLQDILLRKPGDIITIQEDGGEQIVIKRGFCVFATANEASVRYQSRAVLDPAFRDRFKVLPIEYPDGGTPIVDSSRPPLALTRLAYTYVTSESGVGSQLVLPGAAKWLASLAHASQQLYSKPARDVTGRLPGNSAANIIDDDEPRMSDCITPRKMVDILKSVAEGLNPMTVAGGEGVQGVVYDTIAAMQHRSDRLQMFEVIRMLHDLTDGPFDNDGLKKRLKV
ncbi:MAG: hypothetical protein JWN38_1042 [Candidatus Saccharibacteria bacterium]|nr:hypothetical protein [Candidatus Saccharibacteria bacterium]